MNNSRLTWSSNSSSCQSGRTVKTVRTVAQNGQQITTTTNYVGNAPSVLWEPTMSGPSKPIVITSTKKVIVTNKPPPPPKPIDVPQFETDSLAEHNRYRALHNCPPLKLNRDLCKLAADWAKSLAQRGKFEHRPNNKYGENIYMAYGMDVDYKMACKAWYDEIKDYNFNKPTFSSETGHFTQLVWKETTDVGIGVSQKGTSTYVVANYNPPGNVLGTFPANVPKPVK